MTSAEESPNASDLFEIDLCVLAYQIHNQSLMWPLDPFYEAWARPGSSRRDNLLSLVHSAVAGQDQARGPGSTRGWPTNRDLDPVVADYQGVQPWHGCLVNDGLNYRYLSAYAPTLARVADISVCEYLGNREGRPIDAAVTSRHTNPRADDDASDHLFAFEGTTGAFDGKPPAWSLMGIVLERHDTTTTDITRDITEDTTGDYDVHIAYRGSQSGSAYRAAYQGFVLETGNPDWVTDMEFLTNVEDHRISTVGSVVVGLRDSVLTTLGSLLCCLDDIADRNGRPPRAINISGHSLGGALATQLAAALRIGNVANSLSPSLRSWPWSSLQLTAFSAPKAGDALFAGHLDSVLSSRRVWAVGDPIVEFPFNTHAGLPVALETRVTGTANHEPEVVRASIMEQLHWQGSDEIGDETAHTPWQSFGDLGSALHTAEVNGDDLATLFPHRRLEQLDHFIDIAADVVGLSSSYKVPFTKLRVELDRRSRQLRSVFGRHSESIDELQDQMRSFRGIQPGSSLEDHLRELFIVREASRSGWTATDLLENDTIAKALGTYRRIRPSADDVGRAVAIASGPPPSPKDISRVKWIQRMRQVHRNVVDGSVDTSFRRRVPPISGMPHLVPACSHYPGLEWLPKTLMVPKEIPDEGRLLTKYKALYYGLGKIGFGAYAASPVNPDVPWDPAYSWNQDFQSTLDGWEQPTSDETFVRLRTQGPNPFMLRKVGDGYELDFSEYFGDVMPAICARFDLVDGALVPRNISVGEHLHSPGDPTWDRAKRVVNAADVRCIPFVRHLLEVHFIVGQAFALSAYALPTWHSLRPFMHFFSYGTLQVNDFAYQAFFEKSSYFIASGFMTGDAAAELFGNRIRSFDLDEWIPPRDIAKRGIGDIIDHPYVADSLLVWPELEGAVRRYFEVLGFDDATIASDTHLQVWHLTLCDLIPNVDATTSILTMDRLVELSTAFLYNNVVHEICGDMSPILGSMDPDDKAIINLSKFVEAVGDGRLDSPVPAPTMADVFLMDQASFTSAFNVGGNNLMTLVPPRWVDDPKLADAISDLQATLRNLDAQLADRNRERKVHFSRMLPSGWEASISF